MRDILKEKGVDFFFNTSFEDCNLEYKYLINSSGAYNEIAPNNYEDIVKKGNIDHYKIFKKEGDFYKVVSLARKNLKENNEYGIFYQYGWKNRFDFLNKFKITKVLVKLLKKRKYLLLGLLIHIITQNFYCLSSFRL